MKNFGINQVGIQKYQTGTVKGGLQPQQYSGSWGDRGQGNELQSAFENGLSWVADKVVNAGDYMDQGLAYLTGLIPGGMTADESLQDTRLAQTARNAGEPGYTDIYGEYQMFPNAGVAPLPTPLKNPSPELSQMYDGLKKLRWNVQIRESQLRKAGQLDKIESTLTAKKYKDAEQAYLNAVEEFKANQPHMKRMTNDVILTRKQDPTFKSVSRFSMNLPLRSDPSMDLFRLQIPSFKTGKLGFGHYYRAVGNKVNNIKNGIIPPKNSAYNQYDQVYWAKDIPFREYTKNSALLVRYNANGPYKFGVGNFQNPVSSISNPITLDDPNVTLFARYPFTSWYKKIPKTEQGFKQADLLGKLNTYLETPVRRGVKLYLGKKAYDYVFDNNENKTEK